MNKELFKTKYSVEENGCWLWLGSKNNYGYGNMTIKNKRYYSHRVSYQLYIGGIPKGLCVLHKCDTPACVNPDHLYLGTQFDNMKDAADRIPNKRLKLNRAKALEIKEKRKSKTVKELAVEYGVHHSAIYAVLANKTWQREAEK